MCSCQFNWLSTIIPKNFIASFGSAVTLSIYIYIEFSYHLKILYSVFLKYIQKVYWPQTNYVGFPSLCLFKLKVPFDVLQLLIETCHLHIRLPYCMMGTFVCHQQML